MPAACRASPPCRHCPSRECVPRRLRRDARGEEGGRGEGAPKGRSASECKREGGGGISSEGPNMLRSRNEAAQCAEGFEALSYVRMWMQLRRRSEASGHIRSRMRLRRLAAGSERGAGFCARPKRCNAAIDSEQGGERVRPSVRGVFRLACMCSSVCARVRFGAQASVRICACMCVCVNVCAVMLASVCVCVRARARTRKAPNPLSGCGGPDTAAARTARTCVCGCCAVWGT